MAKAKLKALLQLPYAEQPLRTFAEAAATWLIYCEQTRDCKRSTLRDYGHMVGVLERRFGRRRLDSIHPAEIEAFLLELAGSNRTRQKYLFCLASIFRRAVRLGALEFNPIDRVERPRVRAQTRIEMLEPPEVQALIAAAQSETDAAAFSLAAFAGLRIGEILALRWRDVDYARHTIHVRENWTRGETTSPKSGRERAVPMADVLAQRLADLRAHGPFSAEGDLVLCRADGRHLGYKSLKLRYRAALRQAGIGEDFRFHNLRHTFGSTVIRCADVRELMEWMGHAQLATTRRYLAFIDRADAARRVSDAFALPGGHSGPVPSSSPGA